MGHAARERESLGLTAFIAATSVFLSGCNNENYQVNSADQNSTEGKLAASLAQPGHPGDPLPGLNAEDFAAFQQGKEQFETQEQLADGVGPIFNERSCVNCHNGGGGSGGGSAKLETRAGRFANGVFDPLSNLGGSLIQDNAIGFVKNGCFFQVENVPSPANVVAKRRTTALFGFGFVDAMPDNFFISLAAAQPAAVRGRPNMVHDISRNQTVVGRFGWKAQVPTLHQFSGDAYLNEMGITNPEFPLEACPNGPDNCTMMQSCNPSPGLNDDGEDVVKFTNFMRLLAPSPRGPTRDDVEGAGERVFSRIGCAACHIPNMTTPNSTSVPVAVRNQTFHPYSDFLLHDMGSLGDGIGAMGIATTTEMRTQPLWGLRFTNPLLHDGRTGDISQAIMAHAGQGTAAKNAFAALGGTDRENMLAFLRSL
jgi:CxxC motif-containing protein (DUF1111 family)